MERTWISRYDAGVPALIGCSDCAAPNLLQRSPARAPDSIALFLYGARISYRDLEDLTTRLAMALLRLGVRQGNRVALMFVSSTENGCQEFPGSPGVRGSARPHCEMRFI